MEVEIEGAHPRFWFPFFQYRESIRTPHHDSFQEAVASSIIADEISLCGAGMSSPAAVRSKEDGGAEGMVCLPTAIHQEFILTGDCHRSQLAPAERIGYTSAVRCLQELPPQLPTAEYPGVRSRFDDFVAYDFGLGEDIWSRADSTPVPTSITLFTSTTAGFSCRGIGGSSGFGRVPCETSVDTPAIFRKCLLACSRS